MTTSPDDTNPDAGDLADAEPEGQRGRTVIPWPKKLPTDGEFLAAIEGYVLCLNDDQEARLSRDELRRLATMARTNTKRREMP